MTPEITAGYDHLGNCPECGCAVMSASWPTSNAPSWDGRSLTPTVQQNLATIECVNGHVITDVTVIARNDAPSPIFPQAWL